MRFRTLLLAVAQALFGRADLPLQCCVGIAGGYERGRPDGLSEQQSRDTEGAHRLDPQRVIAITDFGKHATEEGVKHEDGSRLRVEAWAPP